MRTSAGHDLHRLAVASSRCAGSLGVRAASGWYPLYLNYMKSCETMERTRPKFKGDDPNPADDAQVASTGTGPSRTSRGFDPRISRSRRSTAACSMHAPTTMPMPVHRQRLAVRAFRQDREGAVIPLRQAGCTPELGRAFAAATSFTRAGSFARSGADPSQRRRRSQRASGVPGRRRAQLRRGAHALRCAPARRTRGLCRGFGRPWSAARRSAQSPPRSGWASTCGSDRAS